MDLRTALNQTFDRYKINASQLAERSGVPSAEISRYRNGRKDFEGETINRLMRGLEEKHRCTLLALLLLDDPVN
jgi:transcriptional regulator with XRE-family HTH domain